MGFLAPCNGSFGAETCADLLAHLNLMGVCHIAKRSFRFCSRMPAIAPNRPVHACLDVNTFLTCSKIPFHFTDCPMASLLQALVLTRPSQFTGYIEQVFSPTIPRRIAHATSSDRDGCSRYGSGTSLYCRVLFSTGFAADRQKYCLFSF